MDGACENLLLLICLLLFPFHSSAAPTSSTHGNFFPCFSSLLNHPREASRLISFRHTSSYTTILQSSIGNLRFMNASSKPILIVSPLRESHVQAAVVCSRKSGLQVRTRSGGHDYEGLSYLSHQAYIIVDLSNMRNISVDVENETAWVGSGASLGEVYYRIAVASGVHGFPAGTCPTVGVGGHVSGGGFGTLFRKYGLAADNVVDAKLVDSDGRVLDRKSMGEDLFWAIRGGGGASFGVILSWKIRLVPVPPKVTVFNVARTLEQGGGLMLEKWQVIGPMLIKLIFQPMLHLHMDTAHSYLFSSTVIYCNIPQHLLLQSILPLQHQVYYSILIPCFVLPCNVLPRTSLYIFPSCTLVLSSIRSRHSFSQIHKPSLLQCSLGGHIPDIHICFHSNNLREHLEQNGNHHLHHFGHYAPAPVLDTQRVAHVPFVSFQAGAQVEHDVSDRAPIEAYGSVPWVRNCFLFEVVDRILFGVDGPHSRWPGHFVVSSPFQDVVCIGDLVGSKCDLH